MNTKATVSSNIRYTVIVFIWINFYRFAADEFFWQFFTPGFQITFINYIFILFTFIHLRLFMNLYYYRVYLSATKTFLHRNIGCFHLHDMINSTVLIRTFCC
jgi:hypothetical protein